MVKPKEIEKARKIFYVDFVTPLMASLRKKYRIPYKPLKKSEMKWVKRAAEKMATLLPVLGQKP
jgi:hypothetical protein